MFVLLTLRSETLAERRPLGEWLAGPRRGGSVVETELGPLTLADTRDLLEQSLGAGCEPRQRPDDAGAGLASFASWLFSETSGQPFFLVEMLRTLVDRGLLNRASDLTGGWALDRRLVTGEVTELRGFVPLAYGKS